MKSSAPAAAREHTPSRVLAVVPARLGSTRLARKMLLRETGRYLFEHTFHAVARCSSITRVVLATDDEEMLAAAREVGVEARLTDPACPSGTDRVFEAFEALERESGPFDVVINVQGDEPEIDAADLAALVAAFGAREVEAGTLAGPLESEEEAASGAVVKVVCDTRGDALYFSRSVIPSRVHARAGADGLDRLRRHIGVYAFRPEALRAFRALAVGRLEAAENLEQLRWLEAGRRMRVVEAARVPRGVDTREDYEGFVRRWRAREGSAKDMRGARN